MDMQTPSQTLAAPPPCHFADRMIQGLAAAVPGSDDSDAARQAAQELFEALAPRDPADAQLAAIAVAAAQASMDGFARAARPDVSDEQAMRLRSGALAAGRAYASALRYLRKRQADAAPKPPAPAPSRPRRTPALRPAAQAEPEPTPPAIPIEAGEFQARDRVGKPIPGYRTDRMTRAQVLAVLAYPRNPALEAAAIAEEDAMIAEQAARDAAAPDDATQGAGEPATADHASPAPAGR